MRGFGLSAYPFAGIARPWASVAAGRGVLAVVSCGRSCGSPLVPEITGLRSRSTSEWPGSELKNPNDQPKGDSAQGYKCASDCVMATAPLSLAPDLGSRAICSLRRMMS